MDIGYCCFSNYAVFIILVDVVLCLRRAAFENVLDGAELASAMQAK